MASTAITREMYNGAYHMEHNPHARGSQPRYTVIDTEGVASRPKGVTTILSDVLAKDLVGWALDRMEAYLADNFDRLIATETLEGLEKILAEAKAQPAHARDNGASVGSETHAMIERFLKQQPVPFDHKVSSEAKNAFGAFMKWWGDTAPVIRESEYVIYSPTYRYAGTFDAYVELNGKFYLLDFKTTNTSRKAPRGVYPEYFIQLGAYAYAFKEEYPDRPIDGLGVVSVRKDGKLDFVTNEDVHMTVDYCERAFRRVRELGLFLDTIGKELA